MYSTSANLTHAIPEPDHDGFAKKYVEKGSAQFSLAATRANSLFIVVFHPGSHQINEMHHSLSDKLRMGHITSTSNRTFYPMLESE